FAKHDIGSILTELGEQVTSRAEAADVRDHYLSVLDKIQRRKLPAHVSVKLTHLGLAVSREVGVPDDRKLAARPDQPRPSFEFHMLYGIRAAEQRALASRGNKVRVLISYGSAWFAWYMRRLAERPANVWFVLRNVV